MESDDVPAYILPLFFTSKTQEIFQCVVDEDITDDNRYALIPKQKILQDFLDRAAISDFHPAKTIVENYEADDLLVVYDPDFKYGQNFFLITSEEEKIQLLNKQNDPEQTKEGDDVLEDDDEEEIKIRLPQEWVSLGSEFEVIDESVVENRPKIRQAIRRQRKEFGGFYSFSDRNVEDDSIIDCPSFQEDSVILMREVATATQFVPKTIDVSIQTFWPYPVNRNQQYEPREETEMGIQTIVESDDYFDFIVDVIPRLELALQQNLTLDVFINDYLDLGEEENVYGSKADNHLKEYQSFTDLQFSKNKTISSIQWHPTIKGLVAVSCMEKMSFYDRIDASWECLMTPSLILIWSFADPIHPFLLLEAPDDIFCFAFNPCDPNIICAGCFNGQIVLWDISQYEVMLRNHRNSSQGSNINQNAANLPSFMQSNPQQTSQTVRYCAVSNIEHSHRMPITDIQWIPNHIEVGRMGVVSENKLRQCFQLMTCATDGSVLFWDMRTTKSSVPQQSKGNQQLNIDINSSPWKVLDLTWKPFLKVTVSRIRGSGELNPTKFVISEVQTPLKKSDLKPAHAQTNEESNTKMNGFSDTSKKKDDIKLLDTINTKFYVATEDGELVYLDWKSTKDVDTGKIVSSRPEFILEAHASGINTLQRSPFVKNILLTVGGWTFAIWKEGVTTQPLFQTYSHSCKLTCGHWSPSRPSVIFIGKADGSVDIWDFLDKSHEPFLTQNVSPVPAMAVFPYQISNKQQLLGVGDEVGTLHIMEIPWNLRHAPSNELAIFENFLEREFSRIEAKNTYGVLSLDTDATPLKARDHEMDEAWETQAKADYEEYKKCELKLLEDLGLVSKNDDDI